MERFSQFRDKGTSIAPFLPIPPEPAGLYLPLYLFLFAFRIPFLVVFILSYFFFIQWLPIGAIGKKISLWAILGVPGIWWIDLQIDGVKKGSLSQNNARLPQAGSIIASSTASPIDALYLAAIFDPMFTASYPNSRLVERISMLQAVVRAFAHPRLSPPSGTKLVDLETLVAQNPDRVVVVFPECTTSNGRGILPFSPSLLSASARTKVFPVSLRYTPPDITSPLPHTYIRFLWNLCSRPTHCIRIRIAEAVYNTTRKSQDLSKRSSSYTSNYFDQLEAIDRNGNGGSDASSDDGETMSKDEKAFLDRIGEALARLGRVKRVGLGVPEKIGFVKMWTRNKK